MIYVIETTYYNKITKEIIDLLKIGYTRDKDKRFTQYKLHNPLFQVLYEIPECDEEIEKSLHYYFKEYQYQNYGNEWFIYTDEIINFFKEVKSGDDIIKILNSDDFSYYGPIGNRVTPGFNKAVSKLIDTCLNIKFPGNTYIVESIIKEKSTILSELEKLKIITIGGC